MQMKRGELWLLQDDGYASKPRPVVVVQSDTINQFHSVVLCLLTSFDSSGWTILSSRHLCVDD